MEISNDENNFLIFRKGKEPEVDYDFELDEKVTLIMGLLKQDDKLNTMFAKLVPTRNNEELFWKSYFYQVTEVKLETLENYSKEAGDADQAHDELLGELDNELDEDAPAVTSSLPPVDTRLLQK